MPVFVHAAPLDGLDDVVAGFLECAEFTMDEEYSRKGVKGWTREAEAKAELFCKRFLAVADPDDLKAYRAADIGQPYGYSHDACLGHDIWYDMNGYGIGFRDRAECPENKERFERLADVARRWLKGLNVWRGRNGYLHLE